MKGKRIDTHRHLIPKPSVDRLATLGIRGTPAEYDELLAELDRQRTTVFVHAADRRRVDTRAGANPFVEYPTDIAGAYARLVFDQVFDRFPRIRWIFASAAGVVARSMEAVADIGASSADAAAIEPSRSALALLARATKLKLQGRLHFPTDHIGQVHATPGEDLVVFREMALAPGPSQPAEARAISTVRFRFSRLSAAANKRLSVLPAPLIAAQPGFRRKTWMLGQETAVFQGVYKWDSVRAAEAYETSLPMKLLSMRAVPGSLSYEVATVAAGTTLEVNR